MQIKIIFSAFTKNHPNFSRLLVGYSDTIPKKSQQLDDCYKHTHHKTHTYNTKTKQSQPDYQLIKTAYK